MTDTRAGELAREAVSLTELPLPDPSDNAEVWNVASAARQWRSARQDSLSRDEAAQREEELSHQLEEAYRRGVVDGRAAAETEGLELVRALNDQLASAVEQSDIAVKSLLDDAASDMVQGAVVLAQWVLAREISIDPSALLDVAATALAQSGGVAGSQVRVNPALGRAAARWSTRFGVDGPQVVEDPSIDQGTVVIKSAHEGTATVSLCALLERACELLDVPALRPAQGSSQ